MAAARKAVTFYIDLSAANAEEELITASEFRNFLVWKLKVNGKPLLSPAVASKDVAIDKDELPVDEKAGITVAVDGSKIVITAKSGLSKRYLKYLTKRYIAFVGAREFLRVVASSKDTYAVKQVRTAEEDEEEEDDEEEADE